ncbi:SRR1-like protein [Panonychus citri]|uniref:SRR1-like protein n=1 Tax=Panonychus citri TaxID=50023 RepID=UPI00230814E1|nr:SRR1-like protein [Panonychus citri]
MKIGTIHTLRSFPSLVHINLLLGKGKTDCILTCDLWLIYDPVFTEYEKKFLIENGFNLIDVNEKGAKSVTTRTLFFMPHCPLPMYNNLLWANWLPNNLNQIVLLGTSFNSLVNSFISSDQQAEYSYLIGITESKLIDEFKLDPPRDIYEAFNDLSVHFFTRINDDDEYTNLLSIANCDPKKKPIYSDDIFSKEMFIN